MKLTLFIILMFAYAVVFGQISRGTVKESLRIESEILGKTVNYSIYLPFDYEESDRYYPVTYLLHGYTDDETGWIQFGEANMMADELIASREIPSMIIAMPDGGVSYYINNFDGTVMYEDFFIKEFIPYIEKHYRIRTEPRYRGIMGQSMGGFGTLQYALKYPEMFSGAVAFSAAILSEEFVLDVEDQKFDRNYSPVFGAGLKGNERLTNHYRSNNLYEIIEKQDLGKYRNLRLMLDCGDDDFFATENCKFNAFLNEKGISHEFRMRDGAHNWGYWRSILPDALMFLGSSYRK